MCPKRESQNNVYIKKTHLKKRKNEEETKKMKKERQEEEGKGEGEVKGVGRREVRRGGG